MDSAVRNLETRIANGTNRARTPVCTRITIILLILLLVPLFAFASVDLAHAWKTKRLLSNAALEAARITVSTPLAARTCTDRTPDHPPCSIELAASAAKAYLANSGFDRVACLTPNTASFSGVLVWVFSCDGKTTCDTMNGSVCLKIDMTALQVERSGTLIPSTRVTLLYPHDWTLGSALKQLPGGSKIPLPKSLEGSALVRD
jgi:hypothetical protein